MGTLNVDKHAANLKNTKILIIPHGLLRQRKILKTRFSLDLPLSLYIGLPVIL